MQHENRDINRIIGQNIRLRRKLLGITVEMLGKKVGVSTQQIYRYECGQDRVSAATLAEIAIVLQTEIKQLTAYFIPKKYDTEMDYLPNAIGRDKEMLKIVQNYNLLPTDRVKLSVSELLVSIVKALSTFPSSSSTH